MVGDGSSAPCIAFLHGGHHGSWCWQPLIDAMVEGGFSGRLIALDMPGCGTRRGQDASGQTLASLAAALNADLRAAGVERAVLAGHSIAGALMPIMAAADPALYSRLVFLATCAPVEGQSVTELMGTAVHGDDPDKVGFPLDPRTTPVEQLCAAMFGPDLSEPQFDALMREVALDITPAALFHEPISRDGYPAGQPATYIVTTRDPILPPAWQRRFAERPSCESVVELDTPHEPFFSHPGELAGLLQQLLGS